MTLSVLVVEDDPGIRDVLQLHLRHAGWEVTAIADGSEALRWFETHGPTVGLVILDLMLPGLDGRGLCRRIRAGIGGNPDVPIIMLTALDDGRDRLEGFALGADDYVVKPFLPDELVARGKAILRRLGRSPGEAGGTGVPSGRLAIGRLVVDRDQVQATVDGSPIPLRPREFDLLVALATRPGVVYSREVLLEQVWGGEPASDSRTVDMHVSRLRERLEAAGAGIRIEAVRGVGYRLQGDGT